MIATILSTAVVFALLVSLMAIGVIVRGKALSGSCGGVPGSSCKCSNPEREACEAKAGANTREAEDENPLRQLP